MQAYLMFGDRTYLEMFTELYVATMKHMQVRHYALCWQLHHKCYSRKDTAVLTAGGMAPTSCSCC